MRPRARAPWSATRVVCLGASAVLGFAAGFLRPTAAARRVALTAACFAHADLARCEDLGVDLERGALAPEYPEEAGVCFGLACAGGRATACRRAQAWARRYGDYEAFELDVGCMARNDAFACEEIADALRGEASEVQLADGATERARLAIARTRMSRALRLHRAACDRGRAEDCLGASRIYRAGFGVELNLRTAHAHARQACDLGLASGCEQAGDDVHGPEAIALYQRACDGGPGAPHACFKLAREREASGAPSATVAASYRHACARLVFDACRWVARDVRSLDAEAPDVVQAFERWCEAGDAHACALVAARMGNGA